MKKIIAFTSAVAAISAFTIDKTDTVDPTDCIKAKCPNEYDACSKDPKCFPILQDCENKCGTSQTCWGFCLNKAGDKAATDTAKCAAKNGCVSAKIQKTEIKIAIADPTDCLKEKCPNEYDVCTKDPKCLPILNDCETKCGTNQTCWGFCLNKAGDKAAIDAAKCAAKNGCVGEKVEQTRVAVNDPTDCLKEKCPNEYDVCTKDPKCLPILNDCETKCGTNQTCWGFCLNKAGDKAAIDAAKCAAKNGCVGEKVEQTRISLADPTDCIKEKCPTQYDACTKDSKCLPALNYCEKKCGSSQTCWSFCLPGQGSQAAIDTAKCAAKNGCVGNNMKSYRYGFEQCMFESCNSVVEKCLSDKMCKFFLLKCRVSGKVWQFDLDCLSEKSAFHPKVASWYKCGGENKCL